jgi:hypothetical protein
MFLSGLVGCAITESLADAVTESGGMVREEEGAA